MLHSLRIAVTALGLTVAAVVLVWWVRSLSVYDRVIVPTPAVKNLAVTSQLGRLQIGESWLWAGAVQSHRMAADERTIMHSFWRDNEQGWFLAGDICGDAYVWLPHWCPLLVAAAVAGLPWLDRLRWRFSLRGLLVAVTLVAAFLGLIAVSL